MSQSMNLWKGVLFVALAYGAVAFFVARALGITGNPALLVALAALPALFVGLYAYPRNPAGRWWIAPIITVVATFALLLAAFVLIATQGKL